jgi:hypothetical protein
VVSVRFTWSPLLVDLRHEVCRGAQWQKRGRQWLMSDNDATKFVHAAQARLDFSRSQARIIVDGTTWVVGFVRGAPFRLLPATTE